MKRFKRVLGWQQAALAGFRRAARLSLAALLPALSAAAIAQGTPAAASASPVAAAAPKPASSRPLDPSMVPLSSAIGSMVAADIGQILQRGELIVAMLGSDSPPFFQVKNDTLVGTDVRMAEQIAKELKVKLRIDRSAQSFNEVVAIVARGDADLGVSKLSRTLVRAQSVRFSEPYLSLNHALILNRLEFAKLSRDTPLPTVLRSFTGSIGVIDKSSFADFATRNFPKAKIVPYTSWNAVINAVKKGEVVGAYRDEFEIRRILKEDPSLALTLRTVTLKDLNDTLGIAVGVRSPTLLAFVNQYLAQRTEKLTVDSVLAELK
jgi:ABC-type amino acid transport substrate-binding protein